jgi:uncharacterized membrane protein YdbT with pleckstrin-like domain
MEENIQKYHPLGNKTLFMFIFKNSGIVFLLLLILLIGMALLDYMPSDFINIATNMLLTLSLLLLVVLVIVLLASWLQYIRYWIFIDDKGLKIARGLIATEQIGIPYRHIQDIKIERSLASQIFGVSDISITILDSEENEFENKENTIVLPSIEKQIALKIQDIVVKKAQVQQINVLGGQNTPQIK